MRLSVTDDGSAFDLAHVATTPLGVAGMRARAEKLGGRLEIRSRPGDGTTVTTDIPLALPDPAPSAATSA